MSSALEIGAADLTPAARSTTALQIGPPRLAAAQSRAIMWRASPAAASCFLPDYGVHPHRRQTTRTTKRPAPSAPLNRIGDDAVAIIARACSDILHANHVACSSSLVELLPHLTAVRARVAGLWLATAKVRTQCTSWSTCRCSRFRSVRLSLYRLRVRRHLSRRRTTVSFVAA